MKLARFLLPILLLCCLFMAAPPSYADRQQSGIISANGQSVTISTDSMSTVTFTVAGTFVGTMTYNSFDGTTATSIVFHRTDDGSNARTSTITAPLAGMQTCVGMRSVQIIATAWTSGVATISLMASPGSRIIQSAQSVAANLNETPNSVYNSSPPAPSAGASVPLQSDASGNLKDTLATLLWNEDAVNSTGKSTNKVVIASTYTPSLDTSFGTAVTHNAKASAGVLYGIDVTNINAAVRYFQIFNSTGGTGTVLMSFPIPAGTSTAPARLTLGPSYWGPNGLYLSTGLTWGISTTQATYTGATTTDHNVNLLYYRSVAFWLPVRVENLKHRPIMSFNSRASMRFNTRRAMAEAW